MLRDLLAYVLAPYPWHLAPMGYVREIAGIGRRAEQCAQSWRSLLQATKAHIARAASLRPSGGRVVVVGSGLWLDVPIKRLCAHFDHVTLVDIYHPLRVRRMARAHPKVELVQGDITGAVKPVFDYVRRRRTGPLPEGRAGVALNGPVDLVVSVNLLSQLAVIPRRYVAANQPSMPPHMLDDFGRSLVEGHLAWLRRAAASAVLVTDTEREEEAADGKTVRKTILEGVTLPAPDAAWSWEIAPRGSVYRDIAVRHRVAAYDTLPTFEPSLSDCDRAPETPEPAADST